MLQLALLEAVRKKYHYWISPPLLLTADILRMHPHPCFPITIEYGKNFYIEINRISTNLTDG
jgi:hypothetical protein